MLDKPPILPDIFRTLVRGSRLGVRARIRSNCSAKAQAGRSALLIAPTGAGKTLAGFLPTLVELSAERQPAKSLPPKKKLPPHGKQKALLSPPAAASSATADCTLYISPLKALAVDIARNLERPVADMKLPIRIETRTGDTPASKRMRQRRDPPDILLTTPEQLALLLSTADGPFLFSSLRRIVLDELHSLVMSKRGDLLSLDLARLSSPRAEYDHGRPSATVARAGRSLPLSRAANRQRRAGGSRPR